MGGDVSLVIWLHLDHLPVDLTSHTSQVTSYKAACGFRVSLWQQKILNSTVHVVRTECFTFDTKRDPHHPSCLRHSCFLLGFLLQICAVRLPNQRLLQKMWIMHRNPRPFWFQLRRTHARVNRPQPHYVGLLVRLWKGTLLFTYTAYMEIWSLHLTHPWEAVGSNSTETYFWS